MAKTLSIHPTSSISSQAKIGSGTRIWQFCTVLGSAKIGRSCLLSQNVYVESRVRIGNRVKIKNNVSLFECVSVEDDVFIGPSVVFTNVINPRSFISRKKEFLSTRIKEGATLGGNATILCGITIGKYAFVAAGAVVTKDVSDYALMVGSPARIRGWMCVCGKKLTLHGTNAHCTTCGKRYRYKNRQIELLLK